MRQRQQQRQEQHHPSEANRGLYPRQARRDGKSTSGKDTRPRAPRCAGRLHAFPTAAVGRTIELAPEQHSHPTHVHHDALALLGLGPRAHHYIVDPAWAVYQLGRLGYGSKPDLRSRRHTAERCSPVTGRFMPARQPIRDQSPRNQAHHKHRSAPTAARPVPRHAQHAFTHGGGSSLT